MGFWTARALFEPRTNLEEALRLRRNQLCPIHRSLFCCGREAIPRERRQRQIGVRRVDDPHHLRGYREIRSNAEMRKLMDKKILTQGGECGICHERFTNYCDIVPDHISPRGMGRRLAGRSSGEHSGCPLVVQRREGVE